MVYFTKEDSKDLTRLSSDCLTVGFVVAQYQNEAVQKFFHRLNILNPKNVHFLMISANSSLMMGSYKHALCKSF